jgi:TRAP-type C4-dicarboxylate transport system permease small subunit
MHAPPYWRIVGLTTLLCLVVAGAGGVGISMAAGLAPDDLGAQLDLVTKVVSGVLPVIFILLLIYVAIVGAIFTARRQSHFQKKVVPLYADFLRGHNPDIPQVTKG